MKKILVTTDFSANSKAAMRFAIQFASQGDVAVTFLHVQHIQRLTSWTEATYAAYEKEEIAKARKTLERFVGSVYKSLKITPTNQLCVIENSPFVDSTIMRYASGHHVDFICISARGAGMMEKLLGTSTANLVGQSPVPVIAVPGAYRATKLTALLYTSDLGNLEPELTRVVELAKPLGASVELLHLSTQSEFVTDPEIIRMAVQKYTDYPVTVHLKPRDVETTLIADIERVIKAQKPSLLIMFTTQREGFFDRLLLSSNAVDYSFLTTVPLLVFSKA
ncbi:universal stress protein [Spirosoma validum]|uniref:Universal stress protein n=1 Tax=Spirosoma validum TaxID=2771355 RepID=A0A927B7D9_9BACT|nr:universal stress protein [Spirosoma validum]MBD2756522.1 universal stress protein [Spirosoma validum]